MCLCCSCRPQNDYYGDLRPAGPTTITFYDGLSRVIATDAQGFDSGGGCTADTYCWIRVATIYDSNGRVWKTSRPYFLNGGTAKYTVFSYDTIGRVYLKTEPGSVQTNYGYHGLTTTVTNDLNQVTTSVKNAQGLVASAQDNETSTTTYTYTAFGDLTKVTDPLSNQTQYTYDIRGRKLTASDPDMNSWSYVYDGFGELYSQTDAKSQTTTLAYDKLGRVLSRTEPDLTSTWGYDSGTHGIGHLTSESATGTAAGSGVSRSYAFADGFGRISSATTTVDGTSYAYTYAYHSNGQIATVAYPSGFTAYLNQTGAGYQLNVQEWVNNAPGQTFWSANTRDAELHLLTQTTAGSTITTTQTFDTNNGRPLTTLATSALGTVASQVYAFDTLGNLIKRSWLNASDATVTERACYDDLDRLSATS